MHGPHPPSTAMKPAAHTGEQQHDNTQSWGLSVTQLADGVNWRQAHAAIECHCVLGTRRPQTATYLCMQLSRCHHQWL